MTREEGIPRRQVLTMAPPSGGAHASGSLLYLYAILPEGSAAGQLLEQGSIPGVLPAARLFALRSAGLIAAVSEVPAAVFQEDALNTLMRDLSSIGPYALRHNEAIGSLMRAAPALIPLSFGTVFVIPEGVEELLRRNAESFRQTLRMLNGKQEWTVKVFVDAQAMAEATAGSGEALRLAEEAEASTPGRAYMLRKRREEVLTAEAARLQGETLRAVLTGIEQATVQSRLDDLPPQEPAAQHLALKVSALVTVDRLDAFQAAVASLQDDHRRTGIHLEVTGPWPPYSFVGGSRESS